jgi:hypothetical protein
MASARSPHDLKLHDSIVEEVLALKLLRREQSHAALSQTIIFDVTFDLEQIQMDLGQDPP